MILRVGLYDNLPRRGRAVQIPRVLGSQQGWNLWQDAPPVLLDLLPPSRRCCRKRELYILSPFLRAYFHPGCCRPLLHPIYRVLHRDCWVRITASRVDVTGYSQRLPPSIFPPTAWIYAQFCAANMGMSGDPLL